MKSEIRQWLSEDVDLLPVLEGLIRDKKREQGDLLDIRDALIADHPKCPELAELFWSHSFAGRQYQMTERLSKAYGFWKLGLEIVEKKVSGRVVEDPRAEWLFAYEKATNFVNIVEVVSLYLELPRGGFRRNLACPFHKDDTPSLHVYEESNRFKCFGCGLSGSPIDFVMQMDGVEFKDAVWKLSKI